MKTAIALLMTAVVLVPGVRAEDRKKPAPPPVTADTLDRDLKRMEDLLAFHEKDKKMSDAAYRADIVKRLRRLYEQRAAELKDLWAALAEKMRQNDYPYMDRNTKADLDAKFKTLKDLEKRLKAILERIDKLESPPSDKKGDPKPGPGAPLAPGAAPPRAGGK